MCSITNKTISDGDEMVVQLMLPAGRYDKVDTGNMFVDSFLRVVEEKGLDEAKKTWKEATKTWKKDKDLNPNKGMIVSNDSPCMDWVPFGPAIRGTYDDYGNIATSEDPENLARIALLEKILCAPFQSIMEAATDDRWYTIGIAQGDKSWQQEGITKETPEFAMMFLKQLSVTYMHAAAYDELKQFDFSPEDGKMSSKYDVKWKNEYLDRAKKKMPEFMKGLLKYEESTDPNKELERFIHFYEMDGLGQPFRMMKSELAMLYLVRLYREKADFEWYWEQLSFLYSLGGMCLNLRQSNYGSQHRNWKGWARVNAVLDAKLKTEENEE